MNRKLENDKAEDGAGLMRNAQPSVFEQAMTFQCEMRAVAGLEPLPSWTRPSRTPERSKNICIKLRSTIFKSVLKLKPKGNTVNWRNYGRCIGCLERYKTFVSHDIPQMLKKDGLDEISEERWGRVKARLGLEQMREYCLRSLNLPLDDETPDEILFTSVLERQLEHYEKLRQTAFCIIENQDGKRSKLFWKGLAEGYTIFLNVEGEFSGDDRRFDIFADLIGMQYEIEKMRRRLPAKSRNDLRNELKKLPDFQDGGQKWFNDVCDEIKLSMRGAGHPHEFAKP